MAVYYCDFCASSGCLTGTWTFTNNSTTVTGVGGNATILDSGDYLRPSFKSGLVFPSGDFHEINTIGDDNTIYLLGQYYGDTIEDATNLTMYNSGNGTEYNTKKCWAHINQYSTDTVRYPGDILYVRAARTLVTSCDIDMDEDGVPSANISVIGCDSVENDPWGDGNNTKPKINFNDPYGDWQILVNDDFWTFKRLQLTNSDDGNSAIYFTNVKGSQFHNCDVHHNQPAGRGAHLYFSDVYMSGCSFSSNQTINIRVQDSFLLLENCKLDGGTATTDYAIYGEGGFVEIINSDFASTSDHDIADIHGRYGISCFCRNTSFSGEDGININYTTPFVNSFVRVEDWGHIHNDNRSFYVNGIIKTNTNITHTGGSDVSAVIIPNDNCGSGSYLMLNGNNMATDYKIESSPAIWCTGSTTLTISIRSSGAWSTYPTANELYLYAYYWSNSSYIKSPKSTEVLSDATTWVEFTTTFTPEEEGWAYWNVVLQKYETDKGVVIDIKPVVS